MAQTLRASWVELGQKPGSARRFRVLSPAMDEIIEL
jgi:hypothetical protein